MQVSWHPEAEDELQNAAQFYNRRVTGLGQESLGYAYYGKHDQPLVFVVAGLLKNHLTRRIRFT